MNWNEFFTYDNESGSLIWKERPASHFKNEKAMKQWHSLWCGKIVGSKRYKPDGRRSGVYTTLYGRCYSAHRIILEMHGIDIPSGYEPDHIDGDQFNNRISNLRVATKNGNMQNRSTPKNNSLGLKGVYATKPGKYVAQIMVDKRPIWLGTFPTKGLAAIARAKAAIRYHGKFARFS